MRRSFMLAVIGLGCLLGVPGCIGSASGLLGSVLTETAFTAISTIIAGLLSSLLGTTSA